MAWKPTYASAEQLSDWLATTEDDSMALAVETASRAVDQATGRQFGIVSEPESRYYPCEYDRHLGQWLALVDDFQTLTGLVVKHDADGLPGDTTTEYAPGLANASQSGLPWTRLLFRRGVYPHNGVHVTALWGWSAVPDAITQATLIQAARLYDRRDSPAGPLRSKRVDDVSYSWGGATTLDDDVAQSIAGYRRIWAAV